MKYETINLKTYLHTEQDECIKIDNILSGHEKEGWELVSHAVYWKGSGCSECKEHYFIFKKPSEN